MSVLELKNISYKYDGVNKKVLSGINLSFKQGTLYTIMGKSGSGKTTLLSLWLCPRMEKFYITEKT